MLLNVVILLNIVACKNLHLTACSGDKYCMASACICKLESILLFSGNKKCVWGSKFLKWNFKNYSKPSKYL